MAAQQAVIELAAGRAGAPDGVAPPERPGWAHFLAQLRTERGLSLSAAAARCGVGASTWAGWEAGTRLRRGQRAAFSPQDATVLRIIATLSLTAAEAERLRGLVAEVAPDRGLAPWQGELRAARLTARVSATQAAVLAEVTRSTYLSWERPRSRGASRVALARLLPHLGCDGSAIAAVLALLPGDGGAARAPEQPTDPVADLPAWSRFITDRRLAAGLTLARVDVLVGQRSVVRRFELGGWARADGRRSVPSAGWLDRVATALDVSGQDRVLLHLMADQERLAVAARGPGPLLAELLSEARRATDRSQLQVERALRDLPARWSSYERGVPSALATMSDPEVRARVVQALPVRPLLASAVSELAATLAEPVAEPRGVGRGAARVPAQPGPRHP